jgi:hypothetical protein
MITVSATTNGLVSASVAVFNDSTAAAHVNATSTDMGASRQGDIAALVRAYRSTFVVFGEQLYKHVGELMLEFVAASEIPIWAD